eukprot:s13496_g1.t1
MALRGRGSPRAGSAAPRPCHGPSGKGVATSRLGSTVTEDKLTSTSAVIAIITVRAMLSVVACLELGIKTVSYSTLVCENVVMMFAFALDEPWYILNLIVRTVGHHLNHSIAIAFDIAAFAHTALGEERPNDGQCAKVDCLGPSRPGVSMNRRAIWLENIGTTGFDNADCYLHADTSFRPSATGMCFDVALSISGEAC